jgi:hypothetical protein
LTFESAPLIAAPPNSEALSFDNFPTKEAIGVLDADTI